MMIVIQCLFHPHVTAVACKRLRLFCQKCSGQVTPKHADTHDPTKLECRCQGIVVQQDHLSRTSSRISGNFQPQSYQLAELLWTDPSMKSGICVCELISTLI